MVARGWRGCARRRERGRDSRIDEGRRADRHRARAGRPSADRTDFRRGAEPGDALEVKILGFEFLHPYGVSGFIPGSGTLPDDFPYVKFHLVRFDLRAGTRRSPPASR